MNAFDIPDGMCPPLVESGEMVGALTPDIADAVGLTGTVKVFAGGADNACGAIGAGVLSTGATMCSIGTSGVVLHFESDGQTNYNGKLHFFNHGTHDAFYSMGVTLSAGYSLSWFKDTFVPEGNFSELLNQIDQIPIGSGGLLFTPYLVGERTPYPDALIRGSFIGVDADHTRGHFARAVVEGITFSLRESIEIMRSAGQKLETIVSIGGGARSDTWLQIQADLFNAEVVRLQTEQGPALGAAMLAAVGCGWFTDLEQCAQVFICRDKSFHPVHHHSTLYDELYNIYREVYSTTRSISALLDRFRK